jgi:3-hydroxybutyryl-CoA dehydrogenase
MQKLAYDKLQVGIVGLGLMGTSIVACLLGAGHQVTGVEEDGVRRKAAGRRIRNFLAASRREGLLRADPLDLVRNFAAHQGYSALGPCQMVIESVTEDAQIKRDVIRKVEAVVSPRAIIGTNTSGLPVTELQKGASHPERILGIHWAEPAHITRFMEIVCGRQTSLRYARSVLGLAWHWGKEPSLLTKDIPGFITNRVFYAMLREAFYLVESGHATIEDVDRSLRNDLGYWITLAGPFRWMDLTGIPAYARVMQGLFPELHCGNKVPDLIRKVVASGSLGVSNARGFYRYTPEEARRWERDFLKFSYDIRRLARKYPAESDQQALRGRGKGLGTRKRRA